MKINRILKYDFIAAILILVLGSGLVIVLVQSMAIAFGGKSSEAAFGVGGGFVTTSLGGLLTLFLAANRDEKAQPSPSPSDSDETLSQVERGHSQPIDHESEEFNKDGGYHYATEVDPWSMRGEKPSS